MAEKSINMQAALKDAGLAAFVAGALFLPILGLRTESTAGGISLEQHWPLALAAIAVVFAGRLALNLLFWQKDAATAGAKTVRTLSLIYGPQVPLIAMIRRVAEARGGVAFLVFVVFAITLPFLPFSDRYIMDLSILVLTYIMLGWGLNIVVGLAGLLDLGYVAFYAVGAYSYALIATHFDWSFWVCLPLAGILAAFWGIILGFPVLRLRGDYLAIVTLAFGEIIRIVLLNWYEFTNGPDGISGIPRPSFFGLEFKRGEGGFADFFGLEYSPIQRIIFLYYLILVLALITNFVTQRLRRLPIGRAWEALREDEIACRSLGINTTSTKLTAFAIGAMFGGFGGSFFATRQGFISPESFTFIESALILAIVVLGGLGSQIGVVIAAIVLIGGIEFFREVEQYRMLVVGLGMVLIMIWRPRGLLSSRMAGIHLHKTTRAPPADGEEGIAEKAR